MRNDFREKNKQIRESNPCVGNDKLYTIFETKNSYQLCFQSKGYKNYLKGSCIMCDYGKGKNLSPDELAKSFDESLKKCKILIN